MSATKPREVPDHDTGPGPSHDRDPGRDQDPSRDHDPGRDPGGRQAQLEAERNVLEQRIIERTRALKRSNASLRKQIAERRRVEDELRRHERCLAKAEELTRLGSWEWDLATDSVHWSDELYRIFGLVPRSFEPNFQSFLDRLHPEDLPATRARILDALERRGGFDGEERIVLQDGSVRVLKAHGQVELDARGHPVRMHGCCQDVTEARQTQAEVVAARELDRLKNLFLNAISHELRTPLTAIFGYMELLEDQLDGPNTVVELKYVQATMANARRLQRLVDDLLDHARIEAGTFRLQPLPADLVTVVRETVEAMRPQAQVAGVTLESELPQGLLVLEMDPQRVEQVVTNLLANALKFTPAGGQVTVRLQPTPKGARCEVDDTGPGIDPEDLPRLFQLFGQLELGLSKGGTGLGLVIARNLVEAHGGHLDVRSTPGEGACFSFELPAHIRRSMTGRPAGGQAS